MHVDLESPKKNIFKMDFKDHSKNSFFKNIWDKFSKLDCKYPF